MNFDGDEYDEDARRIERDYIDPTSTTTDDLKSDLEDADFHNAKQVAEGLLSEDDVGIDSSNAHRDGVTTREDVESAVDEADGYNSDRRDTLTDAVSRNVGAPRKSNLEQAQFQTLAESVTPGDVIDGDTRSTPVSVVRNTDGEEVGVVGGPPARDVAEAKGTEYLGDLNSYRSRMTAEPAPGGGEALLYSNGEPVGRVDL